MLDDALVHDDTSVTGVITGHVSILVMLDDALVLEKQRLY